MCVWNTMSSCHLLTIDIVNASVSFRGYIAQNVAICGKKNAVSFYPKTTVLPFKRHLSRSIMDLDLVGRLAFSPMTV